MLPVSFLPASAVVSVFCQQVAAYPELLVLLTRVRCAKR